MSLRFKQFKLPLISLGLGLLFLLLGQAQVVQADYADPGKTTNQPVPVISTKVQLQKTTTNGILHPAISASPDALENTRNELVNQAQPWQAYYAAMCQTRFASTTFAAANIQAGTFDTVKNNTFNNAGQEMALGEDGFRAYTQAVMYYMTGNPQYRANALRQIRLWEQIDPNQVAYYPDAQIHAVVPFYYLVSAAELLKYTSLTQPTYVDQATGNTVDLAWSQSDDEKLVNNFINPLMKNIMNKNDYYLNQQNYLNTGKMAGVLFKSDKQAYDDLVEVVMVNKDTDKPYSNGAFAHLLYGISKDDPRNPTKQDYTQLLEMGRDQDHAKDDTLVLIGLARIINQQNTKVDPTTGQVSSAANAVDPYAFKGGSLLTGVDSFYQYNFGNSIAWTQLQDNGGSDFPAWDGNGSSKLIDFGGPIAQQSRGRINKYMSNSELYDYYRYQEGYSEAELAQKAPAMTYIAQHLSNPVFYEGTKTMNYWGAYSDNKITEIGAEYWLSMPKQRADADYGHVSNALPTTPNRNFVKTGTILDDNLAKVQDDYVRVTAAAHQGDIHETDYAKRYPQDKTSNPGGSQIAMTGLVKNKQSAIKIRSNGEATLKLSSQNLPDKAYATIAIPNTHGQWISLLYPTQAAPETTVSPYLDFYSVIGGSNVQVDFQEYQYVSDETAAPSFTDGTSQTLNLVKDQTYTTPIANAANNALSLDGTIAGSATLNGNNLTITPNKAGTASLLLLKTSSGLTATQALTLNVANSRAAAYNAVTALKSKDTYITADQAKISQTDKAVKALLDSGSDAAFNQALSAYTTAIQKGVLLNGKLSDGSLDYATDPNFVAVTTPDGKPVAAAAQNLVDNDLLTYDGNFSQPSETFDFGASYRLKMTKFVIQARIGFPNRVSGTNVYGSNDGKTWTLLSDQMTATENGPQTIMVKSDQQNKPFRYLKLQVDKFGADTDPAYPGVNTRGEFHIFGDRVEANAATSAQ
ncbi:MAG: discoidin domain-containing protein [Lactobacillus sp.]|jgi:hypothetical protein|nr:discoidin domain-containing protein [Lactobacillus sp.]